MGLDTVSLSTKKNMYTVYKDWRYSDSKLDFKTYLLEKDERIEAFANSFKQYNSGDMFTKESVVELEDGRLLCFDPDEFSKAYLIDLRDITKNDINFDMETDFKMIKADKSKKGYETRNNAVLSYLGSDIKTKDGQTLDAYLNQIEASNDSTIVNGETKKNQFYYKNISQMSTDKDEQEYYKLIIESLGGSVDNDGKITIGQESSLSKLNGKIKQFEKYLNSPSQQNYLNTLVLLQQLGLSELELIEKLSPGFLEQVKTYTSSLQEQYGDTISYTDDNGFQSSTSQIISFEKIMTYKYNNSDKYWMYLSLEDRKTALSGQSSGVESINQAADALTKLSSSTSVSLESTMEANLEQSVFDTAVKGYVADFNAMFDEKGKLNDNHTYDEALEFLTILCTEKVSGEILFGFLQDSTVQKNLAILGTQKGTLPTAKTVDKQADEQLTAQKVGNAMAAKINTYVEETYTIMGDKERIEKQKALNATISFLDLAFGGINVKYNENQGWYFVGGATTELVAQTGLYVWSKYAANSIVEKSTTNMFNAIESKATETTNRVNALSKKAQEAKDAKEAAEKVKEALQAAKDAETAQKAADDLKKTADTAQEAADTAQEAVAQAKTEAERATKQKAADDLQEAAAKAKAEAERAQKAADTAQEALDKTKEAKDAKEAAEKAKKAQEALDKAQEAQETAKKAQAAKDAEKDVYDTAYDLKKLKNAQKDAKAKAKAYKKAQKTQEAAQAKANKLQEAVKKAEDAANKITDKTKKAKKMKEVKNLKAEVAQVQNALQTANDDLKTAKAAAEKAKDLAENANTLRQTAKGGIVDTLNNDVTIKRHSKNGIQNSSGVRKKYMGWGNTNDDVATAIAKSVNLDDNKSVKLMDKLADGVEKVADETVGAGSKKIVKNTGKNASKTATATKAFRLGGVLSKAFMAVDCVSAAIDGGMMGYGIAAWAVEKNAKNFVKADGSYDTTRAESVKWLGAASGACLGLAAGMWTSGVGAAINAASGGILGTVVGGVVGGIGALLGLTSAALCFKWFG